jgi:DNA sulfur modification protein DndD
MKLHEITLAGIFAYEDRVTVNLSRTSAEKNLVLIWGRNGKGKTSFISALKLLFAGIEHERWRRVGFPPQTLPPGQFVLGDGDHWMGIINRRTRRQAAAKGEPAVASVEAVWHSGDLKVIARREFATTDTGSYVEHVSLIEDGVRITGKAARERLAEYLPPDYVGFFFFDGEDIKSLAETAERKSIDFDHLLRLSFAGELEKELREAALERGRRTLKKEDRQELREVRRRISEADDAQKEARELLADHEEKLLILRNRLARAETVRDSLSTGASQAQREELEGSKKRLERSIGNTRAEILKGSLPAAAPLLANLRMVSAAVALLEQRLKGDGATEQRVLSRIAAALPAWIDELDLPLASAQREQLSKALVARLHQSQQRHPADDGLFARLDPDRAERIRATLTRFALGGADIRQAQVSLLITLHRSLLELDETDERLMRLRVGSDANIERFREVERQIKDLNGQIDEANVQKGGEASRLETAMHDLTRYTARLAELDALALRAVKDEREARYIERVVETLAEARERLRREARDEVQALLNVHFKELIYDHTLIANIRIDDSYTLNFYDAADRPIGRASLSSGLKQLAATSLLWAMMEASGHEMPVIIDTPLGRIDQQNQDNMLARYYPRLSEQVIILPTNAEIDDRKLKMIEMRVAEQFSIENKTGDSASILPGRSEEIVGG